MTKRNSRYLLLLICLFAANTILAFTAVSTGRSAQPTVSSNHKKYIAVQRDANDGVWLEFDRRQYGAGNTWTTSYLPFYGSQYGITTQYPLVITLPTEYARFNRHFSSYLLQIYPSHNFW